MGAPKFCGNEVDIAFLKVKRVFQPPVHPPYGLEFIIVGRSCERFRENGLGAADPLLKILIQALVVIPGVGFAGLFKGKGGGQALAQNGLGFKRCPDGVPVELIRIKIGRVRLKSQRGSRFGGCAGLFQVFCFSAVLKFNRVPFAVPANLNVQMNG